MVKIRVFRRKDLSQTARVYAKAFNRAVPEENWTPESAEEFLNYLFERQPNLFFIATKNNQIVGGTVGIVKPWWNGLVLSESELFVDPQTQGAGIGRKLLRTLCQKAKNKYGVKYIEGVADGRAIFPMKWYQKIGLRKSGFIHIEGEIKEILENLQQH